MQLKPINELLAEVNERLDRDRNNLIGLAIAAGFCGGFLVAIFFLA